MADSKEFPRDKRVAIVGGGISGIACLWGLRDTRYGVHLFEGDSRLGGHADTNRFEGNGRSAGVDTGFIAMNDESYPQFDAFLKHLSVETIPTDMSFGVSADEGRIEWGSLSFMSFIGTLSNLLNLWWLRLIFDIIRFNFMATDALRDLPAHLYRPSSTLPYSDKESPLQKVKLEAGLESIGSYLARHRYSKQFMDYYIIPMVAAPWCIDPDDFSRNFPAATLIDFMKQCRLLDTAFHKLNWRTFRHGSRTYIDSFSRTLSSRQQVHLNSAVKQVHRHSDGSTSLSFPNGSSQTFDHIVLAVHANQALRLLGNTATAQESDILQHFRTQENICILHSDESLLPTRASAHASWNCLIGQSTPSSPRRISITFDMNRLQAIPRPPDPLSPGRVLVSMNPVHEPLPSTQQGRFTYFHPLFSSDSIRASCRLTEINGVNGVSFAGAWMGYGFHEDGFKAGMAAAERLGGYCASERFGPQGGTRDCRVQEPRRFALRRIFEYGVRWTLGVVQGAIERFGGSE
ncbi:MAG: hypothetical protein MMC23_000485 [Stictis urceolatum]|nr:hypothetical protein [Stictis urceolata]